MNRIGGLGLAFAIFDLDELRYGGVRQPFQALADTSPHAHGSWDKAAIPFLLLLAVAGEIAAIAALATWLPDAMWGPTPVSALIHAATMVTAGIYLLARMAPFYTAQAIGHDWAEPALLTVGWVGCATALWAATIGCGTFDYKRVFAYSTVSSLGYMVMGLGVGTAFGGLYYVFAHAWFKALLFLTAGAAMHGLAGQLDLRKVSGLLKVPGFKITMVAMFIGCLYLAAAPFTAGALSKDVILYSALTSQHRSRKPWVGLALTAAITGLLAFRVWFRWPSGQWPSNLAQTSTATTTTATTATTITATRPLRTLRVDMAVTAGTAVTVVTGPWQPRLASASTRLPHQPGAVHHRARRHPGWPAQLPGVAARGGLQLGAAVCGVLLCVLPQVKAQEHGEDPGWQRPQCSSGWPLAARWWASWWRG